MEKCEVTAWEYALTRDYLYYDTYGPNAIINLRALHTLTTELAMRTEPTKKTIIHQK
jgi:hypothetical protein